MKRLIAMCVALLCVFSSACAEGNALTDLMAWVEQDAPQAIGEWFEEDTLITALGSAVPEADIDQATLLFTISSTGETVALANVSVTENINKLTEVLAAQGVQEEDIWHKRYGVEPNIVYHNSRVTDQQVIDGYIVEIVLNVRILDISQVGNVIDAVMQSGTESTPELILERSKAGEAYQTALGKAAQQAMTTAQSLALSCGMELGEIVSVEEISALGDEEATVKITYRAR